MKISASYQIGVKIPADRGEDLDRVTRTQGVTPTRYAQKAVLDQLARDLKQVVPAPPAEQK